MYIILKNVLYIFLMRM